MVEISVILCAHNPRIETLNRVSAALGKQTLGQDRWEVVLVDNASEPDIAKQLSVSWHPAGRCVREETLGLARARARGIVEAKGEILVFVDDDCVLEPGYLAHILQIFRDHPFLGAVGGYGRAEYSRTLPPWMNETFRRFHLDLPIPEWAQSLIYARVRQLGPWVPIGAGMAVRRDIATGYVESIRGDATALGLGRVGNMLTGGEEADLGMYAMEHGFAIGNSSDLHFTHVVPDFRLELNYMVRLLYMSQYSMARLLVYRGWKQPLPLETPTGWQRIRKSLAVLRRYSAEDLCWQAYSKGYTDGLRGAPPDPRFCNR